MSHHYEDDEDSEQLVVTTERLTGLDWILAGVLSCLVFVGLTVFAFPGLCPDVWNDAAVAAGLRPPQTIFPGFWRVLASAFYAGGAASGDAALPVLGRLLGAVTAGMAYLLFRTIVAQSVRLRLRYAEKRYTIQRIAAFAGALFFACSDPMWRAGQAFAPAGLLTFLLIASVFLFAFFLLTGRIILAIAAMFLGGALAAETLFGFVLLLVCWYGYMRAYRRGSLSEDNPLLDKGAGQSARWLLSFVWVLGLAVGIGVNCVSFIKMNGLLAAGKPGGEMPLMYLVSWWRQFIGVASPMGWLLAFVVCLLPFAVNLIMLPRAVDEERLLPYHVGTVACFTGVLGFAQLAMLSPLWFWTWSAAVKINSSFFQQLLVLCAAGTVVCALAVFGAEACCRDHARLQRRHFVALSPTGRFVLLAVLTVVLAAGVLPGRMLRTTRVMLGIIDDYAREVVAECGPATRIFTDGACDARLELLAAEQKKELYALSLMAGGSPYDQYLRLRGKLDVEDQTALTVNAATGLRAWMREKPERLQTIALQQGFELWKREGRELPPFAGVLARPLGLGPAEAAKGIDNAKMLAQRILSVYAAGGLEKAAGEYFCQLFRQAQFRISRIARLRAERADRAGDVAAASADTKLSEDLDDRNDQLQLLLSILERSRTTTLRQVTPREGLQHALDRADFALAASYARPILKANKADPEANFGMAMSFIVQQQWARAGEHLKVYAEQRANEPAVWNNLAMVCLKMNRLVEAERHVRKALELVPESAEVKDTLKQIEAAKQANAQADASKKGDK